MQIYYFPIKSPSPLHPVFAGVGLAGVVAPDKNGNITSLQIDCRFLSHLLY